MFLISLGFLPQVCRRPYKVISTQALYGRRQTCGRKPKLIRNIFDNQGSDKPFMTRMELLQDLSVDSSMTSRSPTTFNDPLLQQQL